jgi:hypothetical protein
MALQISQVRPAHSEEWDSFWNHCSYATYFHSREWAEIWSRYKSGSARPSPLFVKFSDGVEALLPLSSIMADDAVWGYMSSPDGNYGGWIAVDPISEEHARLLAQFLTTKVGRLYWYLNPYDRVIKDIDVQTEKIDEVHRISMSDGFDAVYKGWSSSCRNSQRKAYKSGVVVRCANNIEQWREYYEIYQKCLLHWGDEALSGYDWKIFQELFDRRSRNIKLWLATTADGLIIGGAVIFYSKAHAADWHSVSLRDYSGLNPKNQLLYEIMKDACQLGCRWYDFGQSGWIEGVRRFKETFGATPVDFSGVYVGPIDR